MRPELNQSVQTQFSAGGKQGGQQGGNGETARTEQEDGLVGTRPERPAAISACLGAHVKWCSFKNQLPPFDQFKLSHARQNRRTARLREVIPVLAWRHPATLAPEALHIGFATDGEIIRSRSGVGQICSHFNNSFVRGAVAALR